MRVKPFKQRAVARFYRRFFPGISGRQWVKMRKRIQREHRQAPSQEQAAA